MRAKWLSFLFTIEEYMMDSVEVKWELPPLRTHNIYRDQLKALGFNSVPVKFSVKVPKVKEHTEGERPTNDYYQGVMFQEDDMIQITIGDGVKFLLSSAVDSLYMCFKDGKLITEFPDAAEPDPETVVEYKYYFRLCDYRNDRAYGREHPAVTEFVNLMIGKDPEEMLKKYRAIIAEDFELGKVCEERKDQKRIRVDVDKL